MARTNGLADGAAAADLEAVIGADMHCVNFPKAMFATEMAEYGASITGVEARKGLPLGHTLVRPVVENAMGVKNAYEIAASSARIAYMGGVSGGVWGDLGTSLGYTPMPEGRETFYVRSKVLVDVRAAEVPFPLSGGGMLRSDVEGYREFAIECRNLGYNGLHCANNPAIIAAVNEVFTPTREQLDAWLKIMPAVEQAERDGFVTFSDGGRLYDIAGAVRVREQLALARRLGLL